MSDVAGDPVRDSATRPPTEGESRTARARGYARRTYLHGSAIAVVVVVVLLVILIAENTRRVKVGWVFGYSHVSLVFLVLFAAVLGWLLGIVTGILVRRRSRTPRRGGGPRP